MSWPPQDKSSSSSSSSPSSSGLPAYRPIGLLSSNRDSMAEQSTNDRDRDRPRLPPLSTLLASSHSIASSSSSLSSKSYPSYASPGASSRTEPSPLGSHTTIPSSQPSPILDRYTTADSTLPSFYRRHPPPPLMPLTSTSSSQQQQHQLRQPQRSSSVSMVNPPVNLPPLTSLSLRSRGSRSPPPTLSSSSFTTQHPRAGSELPPPPRLPFALHSSATSRRRPSYGLSESTSPTTGIGPIRRRLTSTMPASGPYMRQSAIVDQEYFGNLWNIYSYACRVNDDVAPRDPHSFPAIATGDVQTLLYHLNGELDRLDRRDPRLSYQLAQDAGLMNNRKASISSSSSSSFHRGGGGGGGQPADGSAASSSKSRAVVSSGDSQHSMYHQQERERRRTPSDEAEMSSSQGSFTSPPNSTLYTSGLPAYAPISETNSTAHHHSLQQRRRMSTSTSSALQRSPQHSFNISPTSHHMVTSTSNSAGAGAGAVSSSTSTTLASLPPPKRVRKRKDETDQSCLCCSATETPEWRKGPTGPRTLCNACGLLFAKQCRKKELEAQARGERPRGSRPQGPEVMSTEERQRSLAELRVAVNARANASPSI